MEGNFTVDPTEVSFLNCVGLINGTLDEFTYEPQTEDVVDYSGCKYGHSLSALVVCDDMHHITYYVTGWPGSAHDNQVFCNSKTFHDPNKFFTYCQ